MSSTPAFRPVRADARRSRERLLRAALEVVGRDGASASLEEIARTAGVGSATLHRHFPSRWALLESLFQGRVDGLATLAETLSRELSSGRAFLTWLEALLAETAANSGLAAAVLRLEPGAAAATTCHAVIATAGAKLLARAQDAGDVRDDIVIDDVLTLVTALSGGSDSGPPAPMSLQIVLRGLRPGR